MELSRDYQKLFRYLCINNHFTEAQLVYNSFVQDQIMITTNLFTFICAKGYSELATWLFEMRPSILDTLETFAFAKICNDKNNLELLKRILSYHNYTDVYWYYPFKQACYMYNVEIARYLYKCVYPKINVRTDDDRLFYQVCADENNIEVALLLVEIEQNAYSVTIENNIIIDYRVTDIKNDE